jgi:hypothetical protein
MGQMTMAVMLAVDAGDAPEGLGEEGWYELLSEYKVGKGPKPDCPCGDTDNWNLIGFWIAVGASGEDGCPGLDKSFPIDGFLAVPEYKKAHERAAKAWEKFSAWAATKGHKFGEPRIWLVQTEVA